MNFTQKSRLRLHAKSPIGQWTRHKSEDYFPKQLSLADDSSADGDADVIDAGAGDDWVLGSHAGDRIAGGGVNARVGRQITTNSIANSRDSTLGKCPKSLKHFRQTPQKHVSCDSHKKNRQFPNVGIEKLAIEFVVNGDAR